MRHVRPIFASFVVITTALLLASVATAANTTLEAESMVVSPSDAGKVYRDDTASGGMALRLWSNASVSQSISSPAPTSLTVRAKAQVCRGVPKMTVSVDGTSVLTTSVAATSWTTYPTSTTIPAGSHRVAVTFANDDVKSRCDRLLLDYVTVGPPPTTTTPPPVVPSPTTTTPPPSGGYEQSAGTSSPSGQAMPTGVVTSGGHTWQPIFAEDFTKDAALGSWGSDCDASKIVYVGANGTQWRAYPKCFLDTYQKRAYRSDKVLSVHGGSLDFWLHTVDGHPAGANPSPVFPSSSQYQTYGRYEARIKQTTTGLSDYHQAWLLWPQSDSFWQCAESDFPEASMNSSSVTAFAHYGCNGAQDSYSRTVDKTQWHTYTQEWMPGKRNFYIDGVLIGSSTNQVYSGPERWQLQTETNSTCDQVTPNTCTQDGHLLVDWAVVYAY